MDKEYFNSQWNQLRTVILERWNRLTDEDLRQINGRYENLVTKISEKYGISRDEVEEQFRNFRPGAKYENERREVLTSRSAKEEESESSLGKWLVLAGIPLLLLLGYFGTQHNASDAKNGIYTSNAPSQILYTKDRTVTNTDGVISQNVRTFLLDNKQLVNDLRSLRVETAEGVVTVYGTVRSEEQKALVTTILQKIPGVVQVVNKIDVQQ